MPTTTRDILTPAPGYPATEAGSFIAQLDELTERMLADVSTATPEELAWQPAPGVNTIGMLLAHIAIVEVVWTQVGPLGRPTFAIEEAIGIGIDDDGLPLAADGAPTANLQGKDVSYFAALVRRAREYLKRATMPLTPADLDRERTRTRRSGDVETTNLRWVYYHLVEHLGGHYGQILLLRHLHRARRT